MKRSVIHTYVLAAAYGVGMTICGITAPHPAFFVGLVYGVLMGLNEVFWGRK